jgi:hypothetical protein
MPTDISRLFSPFNQIATNAGRLGLRRSFAACWIRSTPWRIGVHDARVSWHKSMVVLQPYVRDANL